MLARTRLWPDSSEPGLESRDNMFVQVPRDRVHCLTDFASSKPPLVTVRSGSSPATCDRSRYEENVGITQFFLVNCCV
jgi:hypothetical protein